MPGRKKQPNWLIYAIGLLVVVVILVLIFGKRIQKPLVPLPGPTPLDTQVEQLKKLSLSDEISVIEKDLTETDLDQIDQELTEVENSLQSL